MKMNFKITSHSKKKMCSIRSEVVCIKAQKKTQKNGKSDGTRGSGAEVCRRALVVCIKVLKL